MRAYAWGSSTHIPRLCHLPETDGPVAEMWFGAHPASPSRLEDGTSLLEAIHRDPVGMLGSDLQESFGDRLPFLMKLLAAREPLSLQVHPTSERARIRFQEQEHDGIPLDAPERTYPDAAHKPELIYALTRFEGMAGFRDPAKTAVILRRLSLPWLDEVADRIETSATPFQTLRSVVTEMLSMAGTALADHLQQLREAAAAAERASHAPRLTRRRVDDPTDVDRESIRVFAAVVELIDRYPTDPGVLVTLLLNHVVLAAGESMFIGAGTIHAYTSGFGVEIMAASDNVLRAGLTPKYVDIPELLEVTNFTPMPPPLWAPTPLEVTDGVVFAPPVDEFELVVCRVDGEGLTSERRCPQVVLCLDGEVEVHGATGALTLARGESLFAAAQDGPLTYRGSGTLAVGRPPG